MAIPLHSEPVRVIYYCNHLHGDAWDMTKYLEAPITITAARNSIGTIEVKVKYRALLKAADARQMGINDFIIEWYSLICVQQGSDRIMTGYLNAYPEVDVSTLDADITLKFFSYFGLTGRCYAYTGGKVTGDLKDILMGAVQGTIECAKKARVDYPLKMGWHFDTLWTATIDLTVPMILKDLLTKYCDSKDTSQSFDFTFNNDGEFEIWNYYGHDMSDSIRFYLGSPNANLAHFTFPEWNNCYTDVIAVGGGNGSAALVYDRSDAKSQARHFYNVRIVQDSSCTDYPTLGAVGDKYLKYTSDPTSKAEVVFDAQRMNLRVRPHEEHGDLWIGDTVKIVPSGIYRHLPLADAGLYRVESLTMTIDATNVKNVQLTFIDEAAESRSHD